MNNINMDKYSILEDFDGNDISMCEQIVSDYDCGYLCDVIIEVADSNVSIYPSEVFAKASDLYYSDNVNWNEIDCKDILDQLNMAWYMYNTNVMYNNLDVIIKNICIHWVNNNFNKKVDFDIEDHIDKYLIECDYDDNNKIETITDGLEEYLNSIIE